jgi:AbrB family looped-hinge helix DNA binding protein
MTTSLTVKGQTTVPKEVRERLKLKPGGKIKWFFDAHGGVVVLPVRPASALRGIIKYSGPPVSIEDMDPANFGRLRSRRKAAK